MKFLVELDKINSYIGPDDWKELGKIRPDLTEYIRLRGYEGPIKFSLDSAGGDLYVDMEQSNVFKNLDSLVNELNRHFPGYVFDPEED